MQCEKTMFFNYETFSAKLTENKIQLFRYIFYFNYYFNNYFKYIILFKHTIFIMFDSDKGVPMISF